MPRQNNPDADAEHRIGLMAVSAWKMTAKSSKPVLRVNPPAAFLSVREASRKTGHSETAVSRAVNWLKPLAGAVWTACPPALLWKLRQDFFGRTGRKKRAA